MHSKRLGQSQQRCGAVVGRFDLPPKLEPKQTFIEAPRPPTIPNTQPDMVENRSMLTHYNLPYRVRTEAPSLSITTVARSRQPPTPSSATQDCTLNTIPSS